MCRLGRRTSAATRSRPLLEIDLNRPLARSVRSETQHSLLCQHTHVVAKSLLPTVPEVPPGRHCRRGRVHSHSARIGATLVRPQICDRAL